MSKIRVLIVDDAVVIRKMVTDVVSADPEMEVAGTAANGKIAIAKIPQLNPDVVTLDVEMPEMNGIETLTMIRKLYPRLPVIMFSTLTQRGAATTIDALTLGANDYVTKPANVGSVTEAIHCLRGELIPKLKHCCMPTAPLSTRVEQASASVTVPLPPRSVVTSSSKIDIVAIGVSTGGPNALSLLLPELPEDLPVPIVIVQHMPPVFTKLLAERLDVQCSLKVTEGMASEVLEPGHVYIAPGNYHMVVKQDAMKSVRLQLNQETPENSCRPAVDVLFRSVVDVYRSSILGVILTGMGQDGLRGCEKIREVGGQILAQDEESSVVWGMPGFVSKAGLADQVLPLKSIADEIVRRVRKGRGATFARKGT